MTLYSLHPFSGYSDLLEVTENTGEQTHVYAAMGMLAVKCNDTETAMKALFQWFVVILCRDLGNW